MHTFEFIRPADTAAAIATAAQAKTAQQGADVRFVAGGTTLIDLMKLNVETPARVIDINRLPLDKVEATSDGGLKIGAIVRNSDLAHHPTVQRDYAVLSQALLAGASAQLRNMATTCRQPAAANAVHVLPRHRDALQQARARNRLPGHHRQQSHARRPGHKRTLHRDQPVGHVRGDGSVRGHNPRTGTEGFTRDRFRRLSSSARQHTKPRNGARTRRPRHARHAPTAQVGKQAGVSEAARQGVLRIRPGVGGCRDHDRGWKRDLRAHRTWRRGDQTLAIARGRNRARRQACQRSQFSQRGRSSHARRQTAERE